MEYTNCTISSTVNCTINFNVTNTMKAPVMVYYQLNNFYQNHRRYVKSKSNSQLNGGILSTSDITSDCDPITYMNDTGKFILKLRKNNKS